MVWIAKGVVMPWDASASTVSGRAPSAAKPFSVVVSMVVSEVPLGRRADRCQECGLAAVRRPRAPPERERAADRRAAQRWALEDGRRVPCRWSCE
jgi:hypothetical protein